ncbi:MAG: hypothetical protein V2B18_05390, partial [Pseudomonadota bacterium]
ERLPERDEPFRAVLLKCQDLINRRASALIMNNEENAERWRRLYGPRIPIHLVPNGCPAEIPSFASDPYSSEAPVVLFLGSLAAPRMVRIVNEAASALKRVAAIHTVGLNKAIMYGGDSSSALCPEVTNHGELPESQVWDHVRCASIGLALATGPYPFDNDVTKVFNYLRGGLPVLAEEPILQNELVRETGFGSVFAHGDVEDLVEKAREMIRNPPRSKRHMVMSMMIREHSWDRRVDSFVDMLKALTMRHH